MRRLIAVVLAALLLGLVPAAQAEAKTFKNCTDLRKTYKYGVSLNKSAVNRGAGPIFTPRVNAAVYRLNKKLDTDRDNIVCEVVRPRPRPVETVAPEPTVSPTPTATPTPQPTQSPVPSASPTVSPAPSTTSTRLRVYTGGPGSGAAAFVTPERLPISSFAPSDSNLKLFTYDPKNPLSSAGSSGVFVKPESEGWRFVEGTRDGATYLQLPPGNHLIDTVEPNGNSRDFKRKTYQVSVSTDGKASVQGIQPNSNGFFGLTLDLASAIPTFTPSNICQLLGQDGNLGMNQGFPARPDRLPREGVIRAIIVPVDFSDVVGSGDPAAEYFEMARGTNEFFSKMSGGKVQFDFEVLPGYVRMPFLSTFHNLGSWNGGDPNGYWSAALKAADSFVDYSKFDVVYILSPKQIPSSSIAYGPAFPAKYLTNDGYVKNGTFSGADAYSAFPGAGWKWMAHETGHLFGLHDLYTLQDQAPTFGSWDLMSLNWSEKALELTSWNRFILDWLPAESYVCRDMADWKREPRTITLAPIASTAPGLKSVMVRVSDKQILVAEYRASTGLDSLPLAETGLLVYTVDMTIPSIRGGWKVVRPQRSISVRFEDAALQPGESVVFDGLTISVVSKTNQVLVLTVR